MTPKLSGLFGMGGLFNWPKAELKALYPLPVEQADFTRIDVEHVFARILTAVLERTEGLPEDLHTFLWDNCLGSENDMGLVTLLSRAMASRGELFLIYDKTLKLVREAKAEEKTQIRDEIKKGVKNPLGVYITFKNLQKARMVEIYSGLEFFTVGGLWKQVNLSQALQFKMADLRKSVSSGDAEKIETAASALVEALSKGSNVLVDKEDVLEMLKVDMTATNTLTEFIAAKLSFYLGLPSSWFSGQSKNSQGDTGEGNAREIEQGLRPYFFQVIKPVCKALFEKDVTFKSDDFRGLDGALKAMTTFDATSEEFVSAENKTRILNKLLDLPENSKGDEPPPEPKTPPALPAPAPKPVPPTES